MEDFMPLAYIALALSVLAIGVVLFFAIPEWRQTLAERRAMNRAFEEATAIDELRLEIMMQELEVSLASLNYRHNAHCPTCGRFAKRLEGSDTVVICKTHDIQVRWSEVPVDWFERPVDVQHDVTVLETSVHTGPIPTITLAAIVDEMDPIILDEISLRELEESGAVL